MAAVFLPLRPVDRDQRPGLRRGRARRTGRPARPAGWSARTGRRCRAGPRAAPSAGSRPAAAAARPTAARRAAAVRRRRRRVIRKAISASSSAVSSSPGRRWRATNWTSSSPAPVTVGRIRCTRAPSSSTANSLGRPDVHHDPVGVEPLVLRPLRLDGADRVEAAGQDVLQLGQRDQPAVRLAQRRQVPDLAHRDQPLVGLVALGHGLEQVDLLVRRRQPGEVELAQPVQLQPLGDLRVQAADQPVLGQAGCRRPGPSGPSGRNVKWWCMAAPLGPATVTVSRATACGQRAGRQQFAQRGPRCRRRPAGPPT